MRLLLPPLLLPQSICLLLEGSTFVTKNWWRGCTLNCHEGGSSVISVLPAGADVTDRPQKAVKELVEVAGGSGSDTGEGSGFQTLSLGFRVPCCLFLTSQAAF